MNPNRRGKPPLPVPPPSRTGGRPSSSATPTTHSAQTTLRRGNQNVPDSPAHSLESEGSAASRVSVLATGTLVPSPRAREVHPSLRATSLTHEESQSSSTSNSMQVVLFPGDRGGDRGGDNISESSASSRSNEAARIIRVTNLGSGQLEETEDTVQTVDSYNNYYPAAAGRLPGGRETITTKSPSFDDMDDMAHSDDSDSQSIVRDQPMAVETGDLLQLHNVSGSTVPPVLFPGAHQGQGMPTLMDEPDMDIEALGVENRGRRGGGGEAALSMQPLIAAGGPDSAGTQAASIAYAANRQTNRRRIYDWWVFAVCLALAMIAFVTTMAVVFSDNDDNDVSGVIGPELPINVTIAPSMSPSLSFSPSNELSHAPSATPSVAPVVFPSQQPSRTPSQIPSQTLSNTPSQMPSQTLSDTPSQIPSQTPSQNPSLTPSLSQSPSLGLSEEELLAILISFSFDNGEALMDPGSPQSTAFEWLAGNANLNSYSNAHIIQRHALATFYFSTNGSLWSENELWLSDQDECQWFSQVRAPCDRGGTFKRLELYFNNVQGVVPPEIALLSDLESMDISGGPDGRLNGTLPTELGLLTQLKDFRLQDNDLSGSLPPEFGAWEDLDLIDLSNNRLNSTLPLEIGMWTRVKQLNFAGNRLSGRIGSQIGEWQNLEMLSLDGNLLTGALPTEIGMLDKLETLTMNGNQLTSLPTEIARLQNLRFLSLENNRFMTTLPTELGQLNKLISLSVANNSFIGPIPSELGGLRQLREKLDLSENSFSGQIPSELGRINGSLRMLFLRDNLLTGPIPAEIGRFDKVNVLTLDSNRLTGSMPTEACNVFNRTFPAIFIDCDEVFCPCCNFCCQDGGECTCRYLDTDLDYLCFF
jgi:hypothetical protein